MKRRIWCGLVIPVMLLTAACGNSAQTSAREAYRAFRDTMKVRATADASYAYRDLEGNGVDELLILENTRVTVYTYEETVRCVGEHDFLTGTMRLLCSEDTDYPGLVCFTVGGGQEHYAYMTLKDGALTLEDLWKESYAAEPTDSADRMTEISADKRLIEEAKTVYRENKDLVFTALG